MVAISQEMLSGDAWFIISIDIWVIFDPPTLEQRTWEKEIDQQKENIILLRMNGRGRI